MGQHLCDLLIISDFSHVYQGMRVFVSFPKVLNGWTRASQDYLVRSLWGRWRREANQFSERGVQLFVWPSVALTRSLTLVVDKWMECVQIHLM